VRSATAALVPLHFRGQAQPGRGAAHVSHSGQLPAATVSFNVRSGHSLSEAVAVAEGAARRILPERVTARFRARGGVSVFAQRLGGLLLIALLVIYLVLGVLYESLIHRR